MNPMPIVFTVLAASGLAVAIFALWRSLRAAFGVASLEEVRGNSVTETRSILLERKAALLSSIKEARFELDGGKLSEEDWKELDTSLRSKAKDVLRALDDDVEPFVAKAEKLIAEHLGKKGSPYRDGKKLETKEDSAGATKEESAEVDANDDSNDSAEETVSCPECKAKNPVDGDWCSSCDARITPLTCIKCDTVNDRDAAFCKKCATELPKQNAADDSDDAAEERS